MSLLLDALKKAAEKKAQKSGEDADRTQTITDTQSVSGSASDDTEVVADRVLDDAADQEDQTASSLDNTAIDTLDEGVTETIQITHTEFTEIDSTAIEATQMDATEVDSTLLEQTRVDSTELDATEVESTYIEQTRLDSAEFDATEVESTQIEQTQLDSTELDATEVESWSYAQTELDAPQVDETRSDQFPEDKTEFDRTEIDITSIDTTGFKAEELESTELESTQALEKDLGEEKEERVNTGGEQTEVDDAQFRTTEYSISDNDITQTNAEISEITGEDRTLLIFDEDETGIEFPSLDDLQEEDLTRSDETEQSLENQDAVGDEPELTHDDVTEFMGDGLREDDTNTALQYDSETSLDQDDTTVTNTDSLSLTQVEFDGLILDKDEIQASTNSTSGSLGYEGEELELEGASEADWDIELDNDSTESDRSTLLRTSTTISEVDIEQLTNDETVTIKDSTATRTFAPDNYDRTLLNLSDQDVSRIFPGMKPEAGAVMTPDYAKKVFLSKSSSAKPYYYKMYAGIASILILSIAIWGLFEFQAESDSIDNSLARLKRDPMPGIITPKKSTEKNNLFAQPVANEKARELLSNDTVVDNALPEDDPLNQTEADQSLSEMADQKEQGLTVSDNSDMSQDSAQDAEQMSDTTAMAETGVSQSSMANSEMVVTTDQQSSVIAALTEKPSTKESMATERSPTSRLQVSSASKADEKAQKLTSAYQAYEQGDFKAARKQYDEVLDQDQDNRDALLGRAAIHVLDNEFDRAILSYQKLLLANPKDSMAMASLISVASIEPQVGESQIKTLLRDQPDTAYLHFALGNMYGIQKRWNEAQSAYFDAHRFKPQDPNYAYNLAVSLEHMGKPQAASNFYQTALDNTSNGLATFDSELVQQRIEVLTQ